MLTELSRYFRVLTVPNGSRNRFSSVLQGDSGIAQNRAMVSCRIILGETTESPKILRMLGATLWLQVGPAWVHPPKTPLHPLGNRDGTGG